MRASWTLAVVATVVVGCGGSPEEQSVASEESALSPQGGHGPTEPPAGDPPMLGLHWARGHAGAGGSGTSPNMTWHGGAILTSSEVRAIFWGTSWASTSFVGDKISGLDTFYAAIGGSNYAATSSEYTGTNGRVGTSVTYVGHDVDTSAAPRRAPRTSDVLAEVCRRIASPKANGYYPVYVDTRRSGANYCAWHSYGTCGGVPVQFGFFFNLDGDAGCDPNDTWTSHSQGLAALANVSGHEISETVTDPRNGGWWDSSGSENADKCAWTFGSGAVSLSGGTTWKIQGNWSNAAYGAGTGYPNGSGQKGCLSGL